MAQDKVEKTYLDFNVADMNAAIQSAAAEQRKTYLADKAARKVLVDAINEGYDFGDLICTGVTYTRWGQAQLILSPPKAAKPVAKVRPSLESFLANAKANGRSA